MMSSYVMMPIGLGVRTPYRFCSLPLSVAFARAAAKKSEVQSSFLPFPCNLDMIFSFVLLVAVHRMVLRSAGSWKTRGGSSGLSKASVLGLATTMAILTELVKKQDQR